MYTRDDLIDKLADTMDLENAAAFVREVFEAETAELRTRLAHLEAERDEAVALNGRQTVKLTELGEDNAALFNAKQQLEAERDELKAALTGKFVTLAHVLDPNNLQFEYDQGDFALVHFDDVYDLNRRANKAEQIVKLAQEWKRAQRAYVAMTGTRMAAEDAEYALFDALPDRP